jgi:hypothetical protein
MNLLTQVALLAGVIACSTLVWLVGRAFRKHAAWGFAVLFLFPVTAVIFGIRHWRDEKGPFMVYVSAFTTAMALGIYVLSAKGGWDTVRDVMHTRQEVSLHAFADNKNPAFVKATFSTARETSAPVRDDKPLPPLPEHREPTKHESAEPLKKAGNQAPPEKNMQAVKSAKAPLRGQHYRVAYVAINPADASDFIGLTVKVKRLNRPEQDCVLRGVTPTGLSFEQHTRGGTFSFKYRTQDIEKLRVLVKQAD